MGRAVVDEDEGLCCSASIGLSGHCTCILACADSSVRGMARAAPAATGEIPLIMPVVVELVGGATWPLSAVGGGSSAGALAMSRTSVGLVRKGGVCGSSEGVPPPSKMSRKGSRSASSYCLSFRAFFSFFFSFFSSFFSFFLLSFLFFSLWGCPPSFHAGEDHDLAARAQVTNTEVFASPAQRRGTCGSVRPRCPGGR